VPGRLRRLNWTVAIAFTLGGSLFAIGAWVAQVGSGEAVTSASIYLAGGVFFSTGGYGSVLQAINEPAAADGGWRWWSYRPLQLGWLAAFVLFSGTLAFGVSLVFSFMEGLSVRGENRLIWAPDMFGCVLFLVSGRLGMVALHAAATSWVQPRNLAWWIAVINQLGSILFFIAGLAAFTRPAIGSVVNVDVANWGTLLGALCFAVGGVMQAFDRPGQHSSNHLDGAMRSHSPRQGLS
jgi:hypothetical protein